MCHECLIFGCDGHDQFICTINLIYGDSSESFELKLTRKELAAIGAYNVLVNQRLGTPEVLFASETNEVKPFLKNTIKLVNSLLKKSGCKYLKLVHK